MRWQNLPLTYRLNTIPVKFLAAFFAEIDKLTLKFIWGPKIAKTIMEKDKVERFVFLDFKTYYKGIVIKIVLTMVLAQG